MNKWEYGGFADKYDMSGELHIGTGIVQVHDIFNPIPEFMKDCDVIISDPPYNKAALSGYYTKAGIQEKPETFEKFFERFVQVIDEISPRLLCLEVGTAQAEMYLKTFYKKYDSCVQKNSWYYGNKKQKCVFLFFSNGDMPKAVYDLHEMDEEKVIEYLCQKIDFKKVGDPCMGKGLVGYYANKYKKPFAGTELNAKRLAVCCERVTKNERGKIK